MQLTKVQMRDMLKHKNAYVRGLSLIYLRLTLPFDQLVSWFETSFECHNITVNVDKNNSVERYSVIFVANSRTIAEVARQVLEEQKFYGLLFPRIPVKYEDDIKAALAKAKKINRNADRRDGRGSSRDREDGRRGRRDNVDYRTRDNRRYDDRRRNDRDRRDRDRRDERIDSYRDRDRRDRDRRDERMDHRDRDRRENRGRYERRGRSPRSHSPKGNGASKRRYEGSDRRRTKRRRLNDSISDDSLSSLSSEEETKKVSVRDLKAMYSSSNAKV